jgi:hypothetical protein
MRPASRRAIHEPVIMPATVGPNSQAKPCGDTPRCSIRKAGADSTYRKKPAKFIDTAIISAISAGCANMCA